MHFSSLSLLGLHFANPQSVHQQLSWWSPGTPNCIDQALSKVKVTQLCQIAGYFRENL